LEAELAHLNSPFHVALELAGCGLAREHCHRAYRYYRNEKKCSEQAHT
jgi:hypothetical protein